jgi:hypothetical protein
VTSCERTFARASGASTRLRHSSSVIFASAGPDMLLGAAPRWLGGASCSTDQTDRFLREASSICLKQHERRCLCAAAAKDTSTFRRST